MSSVIHVRIKPKKSPLTGSHESPPTYEAALELPTSETGTSRRQSSFSERQRRSSIEEDVLENEETTPQWDGDEGYSMDDETFEPYEDHVPHEPVEDISTPPPNKLISPSSPQVERPQLSPTGRPVTLRSTPHHHASSSQPQSEDCSPMLQYDEQTYSIVSKLRALNRQLTTKTEQQTKQLQILQDEKKQLLAKVSTLEADLRTVRQTLKTVQAATSNQVRAFEKRSKPSADDPPSYDELHSTRTELPYVAPQTPRSPRSFATSDSRPSSTPCVSSPRSKHNGSPRVPTAPSSSRPSTLTTPIASMLTSSTIDKASAVKIDKLEQEKRDLLNRHAHQLANYSHELSRLERQVEDAQKLVQAKDYELRLQKSRQLYVPTGPHNGSTSSTAVGPIKDNGLRYHHHHHATLLADALWQDLLPFTPPASILLALPFTSQVGLAFEQLLSHELLSFHDRMVDATTRDWLHEIRRCGTQVLQLHHAFQCMAQTFKQLAACCHIYELADSCTREVKKLTHAEQAFLFVMDSAENEFWCRVPRSEETTDMLTVRSRVMPLAGTGGVSAVAAEHTGTTAQNTALLASSSTTHIPCGLASYVFHTKKPLLVPAGHVTRNPHYSTAPDNTDRLMPFKSASTLLMPILLGSTTLGVLQVCGKLTHVEALGVSISLEQCAAFTHEDQVVLTMLSHFLSGVLPKAAYFTEVESNKVNEETLIQLAPEIFTCLRFDELGKIVIQNAKEVLDADRCSLFVADNDERMLFNWQSDISGKGGVEVVNDVKKSTMRLPFGHGIVGMVAETRELINIPDAYEDPRFNSSWDKKTNYRTKSILTVPILSTRATQTKAPIRRRRSQHDVYGAVITDKSDTEPSVPVTQQSQTLLGVVQVINKSGGAPFRSKDEFLLQTISKLIALAIENSQLFQKTQALCASLGKLIADADLAEATSTLATCAEDIIGVEAAAIYVATPDATELVTFHRKRRHRVVLKEPMYRHSLLEQALRSRELVLVNEVSTTTPQFNAYVDSLGGLTARNVLFMPLLADEIDDHTGEKKLLGVLHLVNTRGRKLKFERFDLFLSIVSSQAASVVASILEKQALLRQQDQTKHLLDTTLGFFKEMSPVGIINAVYNTCASLFGVEKAHLFLWEPDRRAMWTAKLAPNAEHSAAALHAISASTRDLVAASVGHAPSLRAQARRISVLNDQTIRVPTSEGLLEHVLSKSAMVVVKYWADDGLSDDLDIDPMDLPPIDTTKCGLRATRSDLAAGFTKHAVVACPVWDIDNQEIVGIVVLLYAKAKAPTPTALGNLPHLSRQISGALNVCGDLRAATQRGDKLQLLAETFAPRRAPPTLSLTLSARGQLVAFSQPLNVGTPGFSAAALSLFASTHTSMDLARFRLDDEGHRWVFVLTGVSLAAMTLEHFVNWIGKDVGPGIPLSVFDHLRTDLQSVYVRKETLRGVVTLPIPPSTTTTRQGFDVSHGGGLGALPQTILVELRRLLWEFTDAQAWQLDVKRACQIFDAVDPSRTRHVSRANVERALTTHGRHVELDVMEWDLLHNAFADATSGLVDVEQLVRALAPRFRMYSRIAYELIPVLDALTQTVVTVHVLLTALET